MSAINENLLDQKIEFLKGKGFVFVTTYFLNGDTEVMACKPGTDVNKKIPKKQIVARAQFRTFEECVDSLLTQLST